MCPGHTEPKVVFVGSLYNAGHLGGGERGLFLLGGREPASEASVPGPLPASVFVRMAVIASAHA